MQARETVLVRQEDLEHASLLVNIEVSQFLPTDFSTP
jgi:hypothetical protein